MKYLDNVIAKLEKINETEASPEMHEKYMGLLYELLKSDLAKITVQEHTAEISIETSDETCHTFSVNTEEMKKYNEEWYSYFLADYVKEESVEDKTPEIKTLLKTIDILNSTNDMLQAEKNRLVKENSSLKAKLDTSAEKDSTVQDYQKENAALKQSRDAYKQQVVAKTEENTSLLQKINILTSENDRLKNHSTDSGQEETEMLKKLAYEDSQTDTMNPNAFTRDISLYEKNNFKDISMALVSICEMKELNLKYGKESGNKAIRLVADTFTVRFGKKNVYRGNIGDRFIIMTSDVTTSDMYNQIAKFKKVLEKDRINIAFAVTRAEDKPISEIMEKLEADVLSMKKNGYTSLYETKEEEVIKPEEYSIQPVDVTRGMISAADDASDDEKEIADAINSLYS